MEQDKTLLYQKLAADVRLSRIIVPLYAISGLINLIHW
jgi:hypothetical protein